MIDAPDPFEALRGDLGPPDGARERLEKRISATLGVPVVGAATKGLLLGKWLVPLVSLVVVVPLAVVAVVAGGAAVSRHAPVREPGGSRERTGMPANSLVEPSRGAAVEPGDAPAKTQDSSERPAFAQPMPAPPPSATQPSATPPSPASVTPAGKKGATTDAAEEREIVERAQAAVRRGDGTEAMTLLDAHARLYPSGTHAEEREALAVHALRLQGKTSAADARAARFVARYPNSLYGAGLRAP